MPSPPRTQARKNRYIAALAARGANRFHSRIVFFKLPSAIHVSSTITAGSMIAVSLLNNARRKAAADRYVCLERNSSQPEKKNICLLYTSDAADERSSVDLGGRR